MSIFLKSTINQKKKKKKKRREMEKENKNRQVSKLEFYPGTLR